MKIAIEKTESIRLKVLSIKTWLRWGRKCAALKANQGENLLVFLNETDPEVCSKFKMIFN